MKGKKLLELKAVARLVGRPEFSLFTVKLFVGSSSKPELFMPNLEGLHRQCIAATLKEKKRCQSNCNLSFKGSCEGGGGAMTFNEVMPR